MSYRVSNGNIKIYYKSLGSFAGMSRGLASDDNCRRQWKRRKLVARVTGTGAGRGERRSDRCSSPPAFCWWGYRSREIALRSHIFHHHPEPVSSCSRRRQIIYTRGCSRPGILSSLEADTWNPVNGIERTSTPSVHYALRVSLNKVLITALIYRSYFMYLLFWLGTIKKHHLEAELNIFKKLFLKKSQNYLVGGIYIYIYAGIGIYLNYIIQNNYISISSVRLPFSFVTVT